VSQFVIDDQLHQVLVRDAIARWSTARFPREFRPREVVKDERVPVVLRTLQTPTFITIDEGFWKRTWRDRRYCIIFFALRHDEQADIAPLLRQLVRLPEFRTRAARMGKVASVSRDSVRWWQIGDEVEHRFRWRRALRRPRGR
jgi:hypothetical protein